MKLFISTILLSGTLSASAGSLPDNFLSRNRCLAYEFQAQPQAAKVQVMNIDGGGFVVEADGEVMGYSEEGSFDVKTAAPAMLEWMKSLKNAPSKVYAATPVLPLLGDIAWNQDSPYNDLCPQYEIGKVSPTGCVATAMAQVMYYHQWPLQGEGEHAYAPAILVGNTISADFGNTTYRWDDMLPRYTSASSTGSREAVAELMYHCGISVDMVYYSSSGANDYDVPVALTSYFRYDRGMAYRQREHYSTQEWLAIINEELKAGRPVLAYGRSASGGHAYVFDGMDENGLIHVNWGWGGMSNGYFRTSDLTPASQGIGGSDGGFNYSQRIITGIKPRTDGEMGDFAVELASSEGLTASKQKIAQGADVTIKLSGKVTNYGWRDSNFDYALELIDENQSRVVLIDGPVNQTLKREATMYGPSFGTVNLGTLPEGSYTLRPVCRMTGGIGDWQPIQDVYIGYQNILRVTASATQIAFEAPDYFSLKASETVVPEVIYDGVPTLITTNVSNEGDVEYHGEVKVQLRDSRNSIVATTSNYIIDLMPGEQTSIRFTDSFSATAGTYTLCLVDDDGTTISSKQTVTLKDAPVMGTPYSASPLRIVKAERDEFVAEAKIGVNGALYGGLLYTYILTPDATMVGCLFPEYFLVDGDGTVTVTMSGTLENGIDGDTYYARLAANNGGTYSSYLEDENSMVSFVFGGASDIQGMNEISDDRHGLFYNINGLRVGKDAKGIVINGKKKVLIY